MIKGLGLLGFRKEAGFLRDIADTGHTLFVKLPSYGAYMRKMRKALKNPNDRLHDMAKMWAEVGNPLTTRDYLKMLWKDSDGDHLADTVGKALGTVFSAPAMAVGSRPGLAAAAAGSAIGGKYLYDRLSSDDTEN